MVRVIVMILWSNARLRACTPKPIAPSPSRVRALADIALDPAAMELAHGNNKVDHK
jgi:hypothetical protein